MIGFLRGRIVDKAPPALTLDVHGVGYELEASMNTFYRLPETGEETQLLTHFSVREDAQTLYAFASADERHLFRALIRVNGVGPRLALTILSGISAPEFRRCIETGDSASLVRLPGVGNKTAQRLIVEMRDRLDQDQAGAGPGRPGTGGAEPLSEAVNAMVALGYRPQEAARLVQASAGDGMDSEALIRAALKAALT